MTRMSKTTTIDLPMYRLEEKKGLLSELSDDEINIRGGTIEEILPASGTSWWDGVAARFGRGGQPW